MDAGQVNVNQAAGQAMRGGQISEAHIGEQCAKQSAGFRPADSFVRVSVEIRAVRNFADALMGAMDGKRVTRAGWNAAGQYVAMQIPDKGSMMSWPYLYLKNAQNEMVPWVPSQGDLFASDWAILPN